RDVGNPCDKLEELLFDATKRFFLILDLLRYSLHFITFSRNVSFFLELSGDLVRGGVTELPEALDLVNNSFSLTIQPLKRLYVQRKSPMSELLSGCVGVVAQIVDIQHSGNGSKNGKGKAGTYCKFQDCRFLHFGFDMQKPALCNLQ